jgi:DNA polymerase V
LSANHITDESSIKTKSTIQQMDLFIDYEQLKKEEEEKLEKDLEKEKRLQEATLKLKQKYGKNAVLKGINLVKGATGKDRNNTIGGHKK